MPGRPAPAAPAPPPALPRQQDGHAQPLARRPARPAQRGRARPQRDAHFRVAPAPPDPTRPRPPATRRARDLAQHVDLGRADGALARGVDDRRTKRTQVLRSVGRIRRMRKRLEQRGRDGVEVRRDGAHEGERRRGRARIAQRKGQRSRHPRRGEPSCARREDVHSSSSTAGSRFRAYEATAKSERAPGSSGARSRAAVAAARAPSRSPNAMAASASASCEAR